MHPLVKAALASGTLEPATLREMLALQRDWEQGEAKKAFTRALVALKRDLPTVIQRDSTVDYTNKSGMRTRFKHASLAAVMDAITEPMTAHGFSLAWTPSTDDKGSIVTVRVTARLTHAEGHSEETTISAPADTSGNKNSAQAVASTITLLSRYAALALLGIATRDMKDPEPSEPDPDRIDTARNLRAVGRLTKLGKKREDAEAFIGRPVAEWTAADLERLTQWVKDTGGAT